MRMQRRTCSCGSQRYLTPSGDPRLLPPSHMTGYGRQRQHTTWCECHPPAGACCPCCRRSHCRKAAGGSWHPDAGHTACCRRESGGAGHQPPFWFRARARTRAGQASAAAAWPWYCWQAAAPRAQDPWHCCQRGRQACHCHFWSRVAGQRWRWRWHQLKQGMCRVQQAHQWRSPPSLLGLQGCVLLHASVPAQGVAGAQGTLQASCRWR
jgi:hypothetical protein